MGRVKWIYFQAENDCFFPAEFQKKKGKMEIQLILKMTVFEC